MPLPRRPLLALVLGPAAALAGACAQEPLSVPPLDGRTPDLAAVYVVTGDREGPSGRRLVHWREGDSVAQADPEGGPVVLWRRQGGEGVGRVVVLAEQGVVVEAAPGDLRAMGRTPDWTTLTILVPADWLERLAPRRARPFRGEPATRRRGTVGEREVDLLWLDRLALPADLDVRGPGRPERMRLESVHSLADSPWRPPDLRGLRSIDAADLGDGVADEALLSLLGSVR